MADHECLSSETIEGLRASSRKDIEAARLLDCAAVLVDKGWAQCTDAVTGRGVKVPAHSRRARCWCMLGAIRAASVRIGLTKLVDTGAVCRQRVETAFSMSVLDRALWAAARAILGRDPKPHADTATIITNWNDTTAMSGETVARRLRDAAARVRLRIATVQAGIREAEHAAAE